MIHCLRARRCYVMLLDKERSELVVVKASSKGTPAPGDRIAVGKGIAGWVVEHKQPLVLGNYGTKMPEAAAWKEEYGNAPLLAVPILGEEDVYGVLMAVNKLSGGTFSEHDLVTAEMLANHLALCIEEGLLSWESGEERNSVFSSPAKEKPA
jgi:GAF domain-containing protein